MSDPHDKLSDTKPFAAATARRLLGLHPDWFVFPVASGTKTGTPPQWQSTGNTNDASKTFVWRERTNVGLALAKSRVIVLDCDTKPGKSGAKSLEQLQAKHGPLPRTYRVRSGSGGLHYYFTATNEVRPVKRNNAFGLHLDSPGYVLIAGSVVDGKIYRTIREPNEQADPVAPAPAWFAEYLQQTVSADADQAPAIDFDKPENIKRAVHYLTHDAPHSIIGRNGEHTTLMVAATLKDMGISQHMTVELMAKYYNAKCDPPWDFFEGPIADRMDVKIGNAWRYLKKVQPGANTAEAEFGADPVDDDVPVPKLHPSAVKARADKYVRDHYTVVNGVLYPKRKTRKTRS